VRVIACLTTLPNIIHSDSSSETISSSEWQAIQKVIGGTHDDTLVIVWGDAKDADLGAKEIAVRTKEATIGIPSETRQALRDGTNGFERILPGPDRMYPDTDLPPKKITEERLRKMRATLPKALWESEAWYRKLKIPSDVIRPLAVSGFVPLFEMLVKEWKINPMLAAVALIQFPKRLRREMNHEQSVDEKTLREIFQAFRNKQIAKEGILMGMREAMKSGSFNLPPPCPEKELDGIIKESIKKMKTIDVLNEEKRPEALMGIVMEMVRGRIDGSVVAERTGFSAKESKR
jgi:glutamyl-tRNA(Gln) amidotransferase subunit E